MRQSLVPLVLAVLLTAAIVSASHAGPPSPANCTVPPVLVACPGGEIAYTVVVRNAVNDPRFNSQVVLDFGGCPNIHLCAPDAAANYVFLSPTRVAVNTDGYGNATFLLQAGGSCTAAVQITASEQNDPTRPTLLTDGYNHAPPSFASPDQDGDGDVTPADAAILASKAANDPTADLNGDGVHDASDAAILVAHMGHVCALLATPAPRKSWGQIKLIYR